MCALSVTLFGVNTFAFRLPALFSSALLGIFGVKLIKLTNDDCGVNAEYPAIMYAILYAISPFTFMSARFGLESLNMIGFSTCFLYLLCAATNTDKNNNKKDYCIY